MFDADTNTWARMKCHKWCHSLNVEGAGLHLKRMYQIIVDRALDVGYLRAILKYLCYSESFRIL